MKRIRVTLAVLTILLCMPKVSVRAQVDPDSGTMQTPPAATPETPVTMSSGIPVGLLLGGAAILTAVSLRYDQEMADALISWKDRNPAVGSISPIVTEMGSGGFAIGVLGAFGSYGYLAKDHRAIMVGRVGLTSFFATGFAVQIVKHLSGRERPEVSTRTGGFWHGPFGMYRQKTGAKKGIGSFDAFASGHTTTVFSLATTFADVYDDTPWVGYVSYSLASVAALSRVTERTHWVSDCIVGAVIGIYGTKMVEELMAKSTWVIIAPEYRAEGYGLRFTVDL